MSKDEVELGGDDAGDDYEVVPVGPIRKLERRIDEMEEKAQSGGGSRADDELIRDVLDIMKSNQKIVNDMTESTHELKNSVEDLTHKMDSVIDNMNQFMDLLNEASETDLEGEVIDDVHSRIADAVGNEMQDVASDIKQSNENVVQNLEELNKSIKRSYTAQNKDQTLSGDSGVVNRGNNQENNNNQNSRSRGNRGGPDLNIDRGNRSNDNQQEMQGGDRNNRSRGGRNNQVRNSENNRNRGNRGQQEGPSKMDSNQQNDSPSGSDRMDKLKERFNNVNEE